MIKTHYLTARNYAEQNLPLIQSHAQTLIL